MDCLRIANDLLGTGAPKNGGWLILGGIHLSPQFSYELSYQERTMHSVANNARRNGREFLKLAAEIPVRTEVQVFPLREAYKALRALKFDGVRGATVLRIYGRDIRGPRRKS